MNVRSELALTPYLEAVSLKRPAIPHADRRFAVALALSLCLHGALLLLRPLPPAEQPLSLGDEPSDRLNVTLAPRAAPRAAPQPPPPTASAEPAPPTPAPSRKLPRANPPPSRKFTAPAAPERPVVEQPTPAEVQARREAVTKFYEEIRPAPAPASGARLSQQALAMARELARGGADESEDARREAPLRTPRAARNEEGASPLSMELYFEAFVQKLNRSAAFVPNDRRERGADVAVVQVQLNSDGTLRRYRILSAADQQSEIDYVRRVVERAAPFAAFPPDIRRNKESLSFEICILPARASATGGGFSRTFGGRNCHDLG